MAGAEYYITYLGEHVGRLGPVCFLTFISFLIVTHFLDNTGEGGSSGPGLQ